MPWMNGGICPDTPTTPSVTGTLLTQVLNLTPRIPLQGTPKKPEENGKVPGGSLCYRAKTRYISTARAFPCPITLPAPNEHIFSGREFPNEDVASKERSARSLGYPAGIRLPGNQPRHALQVRVRGLRSRIQARQPLAFQTVAVRRVDGSAVFSRHAAGFYRPATRSGVAQKAAARPAAAKENRPRHTLTRFHNRGFHNR